MSELRQLDVRELPPRQRHALIFDTCDTLATGDALVLVNDHDPRPLYYQFEAEQPGRFGWDYLERGPRCGAFGSPARPPDPGRCG